MTGSTPETAAHTSSPAPLVAWCATTTSKRTSKFPAPPITIDCISTSERGSIDFDCKRPSAHGEVSIPSDSQSQAFASPNRRRLVCLLREALKYRNRPSPVSSSDAPSPDIRLIRLQRIAAAVQIVAFTQQFPGKLPRRINVDGPFVIISTSLVIFPALRAPFIRAKSD